ncbi:MAG: DnaA regulatory inactivator Hda [Motiliproteus sp.]|nr:DnaA regulatory inactivator Hda [Motiliproteus sp.]MCW9053568.1 DnaA regulatory inactivator Hda [Motiliproteus sp.]
MIAEISNQLSLGIGLRDDATFGNYYPGQNLQAKQSVERLVVLDGVDEERFIYLWGSEGAGCTHLLQAACQTLSDQSFYLPLAEVVSYGPELLQGLADYPLICLDQFEAIAGNQDWEEGLFHLYNQVRDNGHRLLIASNQPPKQLPVLLPDLSSRLSWGLTFQIQPLDDQEMAEALTLRAQNRGIRLGEEVTQFILHRSPRQMGKLYAILEQLDQASLTAKRKITIPFVKEILGW